jgi:soluble lytic murein transglycosylase
MQLMPGTAADPGFGVAPAKDGSPQENVRVGKDYLGAM